MVIETAVKMNNYNSLKFKLPCKTLIDPTTIYDQL